VSKLASTRFGNPRSIPSWRTGVARDGFGATWEETLSARAELGQTWWLGLRTADGVRPEEARRTAGFPADPAGEDPALPLARVLAEQGFLVEAKGAWQLTERGLPLADAVSGRFLDLCMEESGNGGEDRSPLAHG
jgi:coproporphyrinogen III oxidase-like Fe-S oxidoreductase